MRGSNELRESVHARLAAARGEPDRPGHPVAELLPEHAWALDVSLGVERQGAKAYLPGAAAALGDRAGRRGARGAARGRKRS